MRLHLRPALVLFTSVLLGTIGTPSAGAEDLMGGIGFFQGFRGLSVHALLTDSDGSILVAGTVTSPGLPAT
jgi:hypothetical protein